MVEEAALRGSVDAEIARIAAQQHGVVSHAQLRDAGLSPSAIAKRAEAGRLFRVHRGVFGVGHPVRSDHGRWMAAVLACGDSAALSQLSAAALWGLLEPAEGAVDVSVPTQSGRAGRAEIRVHRCASLADASLVLAEGDEPIPALTVRAGIPVTAPWRTIDDLRAVAPANVFRRAVREAEMRRYALSPRTPRDRTRSDVERDFLRLCREHGLPAPEVNVRVGRWTVDFLWRAERLAVETDSWLFHRGSVAFEDDHARDLDLRERGYAIRRFTERQLYGEPERVVADVAAGLAEGARKG